MSVTNSLTILTNCCANCLLDHHAMGCVRTKYIRCKYGNSLLWWCIGDSEPQAGPAGGPGAQGEDS